jgi:hypothetical protein
MKIILNKLFLIILFILNVSCKSGSNITDPPPINNSECIDGQSMGCDDICSITPLQNDACGVCGGEITNESDCPQIQCDLDVCISIQNVDLSTNILEVWMMNNIPVAGFQFNISGVTIISASEGSAQSNGMTQSNSEHIILGFSLSGNSIPSGNSILTHIGFSEYNGSICLSDPVFSNNSGEALSVELGDCVN